MKRSLVSLREAVPSDVELLVALWGDVLRRAEPDEQASDVRSVLARVAASDVERIVVAEYDGRPAGAVYLRATSVTPLNLEPVLQAVSPHVLPEFRRHGVGRALMEASVAFAEELGIAHMATGVTAGARDANRFMARLALGPHVLLRVAPVPTVKARLSIQRGGVPRTSGRQLPQVLAARRSLRRSQPTPG
ncbi:GNAT family N-acetyltransferase [Nocardioides sp. GCM10027113]|uniref:GNAT family N-acetyltransferase n=1 Tax=unclassified Nocardioides TaxID=2615069 RepID=UPI0036092EC2